MSILQSRRQRVVKAGTRIDSITNSGNNATINAALTPGHLFGMTMTNGTDATNDINFAAGSCRDSTDAKNLTGSALAGKQLDVAWAVGANAGGRMSAAAIANTTYHCFAILKDSDLSVDYGFDVSATAPTMPSGYTYFRRIGSIIRAGATILAFSQVGDEFLLLVPVQDAGDVTWTTTASLVTLSVPLGIQVGALVTAEYVVGATVYGLITSPDQTDTLPSITQHNMFGTGTSTIALFHGIVRTNTSAQIRARTSASTGATGDVYTRGWLDARGRAA